MIPTEATEQKKLIQWLRAKKIFHYANVNENNTYKQDRKYSMIAEQKSKAMGKLKGVSDVTVFLKNKILFIELKRQGKKLKSGKISYSNSKVSHDQIAFIDKVNKFNYVEAFVAYGFDDAVNKINEHMKG